MLLKKVKNYKILFFVILLGTVFSCSTDNDSSPLEIATTLEASIENREFIIDNVIACAGSNEDPSITSVFLYPREGVTNINYYHTNSLDFDKNDYSTYIRGEGDLIDVFNGFLLKYEIAPIQEQWVIVTFEEDGIINISNPIRIKHLTKPTEYLPENVTLASNTTMPIFEWQDGSFDDTIIYFQAVLTENDDLLSATYTFDKNFQYYNLDNVVLNITEQEPPSLEQGFNYGFTLLAVSEDNWVNLFSTISFEVQ